MNTAHASEFHTEFMLHYQKQLNGAFAALTALQEEFDWTMENKLVIRHDELKHTRRCHWNFKLHKLLAQQEQCYKHADKPVAYNGLCPLPLKAWLNIVLVESR
ncbi:Hypothetical predicted protein [Pelobates cultripes]|uniref:Uncharacterized protein n=1 Tax=Pelobates cultripes TaxID=61616 RepID=A0AAD1VT40_PELCU|nr:Hypothetical predicted protein [Pelobates cultripes]